MTLGTVGGDRAVRARYVPSGDRVGGVSDASGQLCLLPPMGSTRAVRKRKPGGTGGYEPRSVAVVRGYFEQAEDVAEQRMRSAELGVAVSPAALAAEVRELARALDAMRRSHGGQKGVVAEQVRVAALEIAASAVLLAERVEREVF